uniref:S-arrestin n=1 Tax=Callorhinchus milii TaxID=7868 RepID=A0A4W3I1Q5_CALMI
MSAAGKKVSTKQVVYKKTSRDKSVAMYLGKRDFVDHLDHIEPVDGVIVVDTGYVKDRKIYCRLSCIFHYGKEDMDVIGHPFSRDLYVSTIQIYPPTEETAHPLTKLQERLLKKVGDKAYPFCFQVIIILSFDIEPYHVIETSQSCCSVDFEILSFCVQSLEDKIHKNSSRLMIRKVQFAPDKSGPQPTAEISRHFLMSDDPLHLEASLDKETYYHGDPINVNIKVKNNSNKLAKGVKVSVEQLTQVVLYSKDKYVQEVAVEETDEQVAPSASLCKTYTLLPLAANNIEKHGIALDGKLKQEETNLASSTMIKPGVAKDVLGMLVSYSVKVKLTIPG